VIAPRWQQCLHRKLLIRPLRMMWQENS
jgi:hypothetical protein